MTPRRWEVGVDIHTCRLGKRSRRLMVNPFTGEAIKVFADRSMSQAERQATKRLLVGLRADLSDEGPVDECGRQYDVRLEGGALMTLYLNGLEGDSPAVSGRIILLGNRLPVRAFGVVHDLLRTANMALVTDDGSQVAVTREMIDPLVIHRWPNLTLLQSPVDLKAWLKQWVGFRRVI